MVMFCLCVIWVVCISECFKCLGFFLRRYSYKINFFLIYNIELNDD